MPTRPNIHLAFFSLSLLVSGCTADEGGGTPRGPNDDGGSDFRFVRDCARYECDSEVTACRIRMATVCNHSCFCGSIDCTECVDGCLDVSCDPFCDHSVAECTAEGFVLETPEPDPDLLAACRTYADAVEACGYIAPLCDEFARVEEPSLRAAYECLATLPCQSFDEAEAACALPEDDEALAARVCELLEACASGCTLVGDLVARSGNWVREDVRAALEECLGLGCDDRGACVDAWLQAVDGEPNY